MNTSRLSKKILLAIACLVTIAPCLGATGSGGKKTEGDRASQLKSFVLNNKSKIAAGTLLVGVVGYLSYIRSRITRIKELKRRHMTLFEDKESIESFEEIMKKVDKIRLWKPWTYKILDEIKEKIEEQEMKVNIDEVWHRVGILLDEAIKKDRHHLKEGQMLVGELKEGQMLVGELKKMFNAFQGREMGALKQERVAMKQEQEQEKIAAQVQEIAAQRREIEEQGRENGGAEDEEDEKKSELVTKGNSVDRNSLSIKGDAETDADGLELD